MTTDLNTAKQFHAFLKEKGVFERFVVEYKGSHWRENYTPLSNASPKDWVINAFWWGESDEQFGFWSDICAQWRTHLVCNAK